jgi:hypothetical protein
MPEATKRISYPTTGPATQTTLAGHDAKHCVDCAQPALQTYLDSGLRPEIALWGLHWGFASTLHQFKGHDAALERVAALYASMTPDLRADAPEAKDSVRDILLMLRCKGFTTEAIAWAMLGALLHVVRKSCVYSQREQERYRDNLILALNEARQLN